MTPFYLNNCSFSSKFRVIYALIVDFTGFDHIEMGIETNGRYREQIGGKRKPLKNRDRNDKNVKLVLNAPALSFTKPRLSSIMKNAHASVNERSSVHATMKNAPTRMTSTLG